MTTDTLSNAGKLRTGHIGIAALALLMFVGMASETTAQILGPETDYKVLPRGDLYKLYIADPLRVSFSAQTIAMITNDIPDTGNSRTELKAGMLFGILKLHPVDRPDLGWQFSFQAGLDAVFDPDNSEDNIGWDGTLAWLVTTAFDHGWSLKVAALHRSSHLGDEYMQRTGRQRINYTRREINLGVSKQFNPNYRVYGEGAYGYSPGDPDLQKPGRFEGGFEVEYPNLIWKNLVGWYAATDLQFWQERDWKPDATLQTGLFYPVKERMHRVGIEISRGRPVMGEFFQSTETQILFGIWIDI